jgi:ABC-type phosphate/phosphonate transport system substrate-binding protein
MIATSASRRKWLRSVLLTALAAACPPAGRASGAEAPLTLALTPSRDPTALQEAGDAFAKTITRLSGIPIHAPGASDYAGVIEAVRSRRWI